MYMDSVRRFKDKWYVVRPVTDAALNSLFEEEEPVSDEDGEAMLGDDGNPVLGRRAKVPVHWMSRHYEHGTGYYHTAAGDMCSEDEQAYGALCRFVDSFHPARWVTREGDDILDKDGYPTFESRPIDTKALVECPTYRQAARLLGCLLLEILYSSFIYEVCSTLT